MESSSSAVSVSTSNINGGHHNLDNLPDLVYYYVLKNLDLDDLWNLRFVSKKLFAIVNTYNITELYFQDFTSFGYIENWFTTTSSNRPENRLHISKVLLLINPAANLIKLKYLRICGKVDSFKLENLNKFTKLQILEIEMSNLNSNDELRLPDLKAFLIYFNELYEYREEFNLVLDTPNLNSFAIMYIGNNLSLIDNGIKFKHPKSIKYVLLTCYDKNISIFTELECLEIRLYNNFNTSVLPKFKNLRKLRFNHCSSVREELKNLFKSKNDYLELIVDGVKIKEINKIDEFNRENQKIAFQLNNYGHLENDLNFSWYIDFNYLVRLLPNQPLDLFKKFTNIQKILVKSRVEDGSRLINFIKQCSSLNELKINESSLDQQFYDQLPVIKSLSSMDIRNEKDLNLNFNFVANTCPYLVYLATDQCVQLSKRLNFDKFKFFKLFKFKINDHNIIISKKTKDKYSIRSYKNSGIPDRQFTMHEVIMYSNWLGNKNDRKMRSSTRKRKLAIV